MNTILLVCCVSVLSSSSFGQQPPTDTNKNNGSICVLPNSPEPPTRISPGGKYNPATLKVRIDQRDTIPWPHKNPVLIDGLDLQQRHLVVLTSDGKRIQSFRFKFSELREDRLCISFDSYQGVDMGNRTDALWCKVAARVAGTELVFMLCVAGTAEGARPHVARGRELFTGLPWHAPSSLTIKHFLANLIWVVLRLPAWWPLRLRRL
jgi:hypothetical protein